MKHAAGTLLICNNTGRFLLAKRSALSNFPKTWAIVGGAIDEGEKPLEAAKRELYEETKIDPEKIKFTFWELQKDYGVDFYLFLGYCNEEFTPILNKENIDWGWFTLDDLPDNLFPNLYSSLVRIV